MFDIETSRTLVEFTSSGTIALTKIKKGGKIKKTKTANMATKKAIQSIIPFEVGDNIDLRYEQFLQSGMESEEFV